VVNTEKSELAATQDFTFVCSTGLKDHSAICSRGEERHDSLHHQTIIMAAKLTACHKVQQVLGHLNFTAMVIPRAKARARGVQEDLNKPYCWPKDTLRASLLSLHS